MDYILGSAAQNNRNRNGWEAVKKCEYRFLVQAKGFRPFESRKPLKRLDLNFFCQVCSTTSFFGYFRRTIRKVMICPSAVTVQVIG